MFYFALVFLVLCIFLIITNRKDVSTKYFIGMMLAYINALFFMMIYFAKDTSYNNVVGNYFSMPLAVWEFLMFLPLNREFLLCVWNLSYFLALYLGLNFAMSFYQYGEIQWMKISRNVISIVLLLEFLIYHPYVQKYGYYFLYPSILNIVEIEKMQEMLYLLTRGINAGILLFGVGILISNYRKITPLKMIRRNMLFLMLNYIMIISMCQAILGRYPAFLMKVSRIADIVIFRSLEVNDSRLLHKVMPYYLICIFILICFSLYRQYRTNVKISNENAAFSRQVDASDTTSKVFCHYMKNEMLAIQYALEELAGDKAESEALQNAIDRCHNLYDRLDKIHSSTKAAELSMMKENVPAVIEEILGGMAYDLEGIRVSLQSARPCLYAMLDKNYFEQALHNVILNAVDAMEGMPAERKTLTVQCEGINNWMAVFIQDTGKGMNQAEAEKIFTPFYTSHTIARHWGIGMTLTHKIISAHEGHIEVESEPGQGTIIKIMLPLLRG